MNSMTSMWMAIGGLILFALLHLASHCFRAKAPDSKVKKSKVERKREEEKHRFYTRTRVHHCRAAIQWTCRHSDHRTLQCALKMVDITADGRCYYFEEPDKDQEEA